jgi:hypothetical protein
MTEEDDVIRLLAAYVYDCYPRRAMLIGLPLSLSHCMQTRISPAIIV